MSTPSPSPSPPPHTPPLAPLACENVACDNVTFQTEVQKITHMINEHACPFKPCKSFFELDEHLEQHIKNVHSFIDEQKCHLCNTAQTHLTNHMAQAHVRCVVCQALFKDLTELDKHNPCTTITPTPPKAPNPPGAFLKPQAKTDLDALRTQMQNDPEAELVHVLMSMCSCLVVDEHTKKEMMDSIANYGAITRHEKNMEGFPYKMSKIKKTILEPPFFNHQGKESLSKVSDFLGDLPVWSPGHKPGDQMGNFLSLQKLHNDVSFATSACNLQENTAVAVLLKFISTKTKADLEAYTFTPPEKTSYASILKAAQDVFFGNLSLEDIAFEAETLQRMPCESFQEFTLRAYNLLSLSSLGREENEKQAYIAANLRRLSLAALPAVHRLKIENLEATHGVSYTARDIADFVQQESIEAQPIINTEQAAHLFSVSHQDVTNYLTDSTQSDDDDEKEDDNLSFSDKSNNDENGKINEDSRNRDISEQGDNVFKCAALLPGAQPCEFLAACERAMKEHLTHTHRTSKFMVHVYARVTDF